MKGRHGDRWLLRQEHPAGPDAPLNGDERGRHGLPSLAAPANSWPCNGFGYESTLGLPAAEMFARQLDTGGAVVVRGLLNDPTTGLAGREPVARWRDRRTIPLQAELNDWFLALAIARRAKPANGGD